MKMSFNKRLAAMAKNCESLPCTNTTPLRGTGQVKVCNKNPTFITTDIREKGEITYKHMESGRAGAKEEGTQLMPIGDVKNILHYITDKDAGLLGFAKGSHPRNMILHAVLVPPTIARPPIYQDGNMQYDQLTHMFMNIVRRVANLKKTGTPADLYKQFKELIYNTTHGKKIGMKDKTSIVERIQGKKALLRELLMGKRNSHCGRTVAGPMLFSNLEKLGFLKCGTISD